MKISDKERIPGAAVFSRSQGSGYIHTDPDMMARYLRPESITVVDEVLFPGMMTTLSGHFCSPVYYLGLVSTKEMIFKLGEDGDLLKTRYYYQSVHFIDRYRIFEMFTWQSGRDFNWIGGRWK